MATGNQHCSATNPEPVLSLSAVNVGGTVGVSGTGVHVGADILVGGIGLKIGV